MTRWNRYAAVALIALSTTALMGHAQDYPTRAVKILVPYGPGTGVDLTARVLADKLSRSLGQPFVVENKTGAAGAIASAAVLQTPADGYTLLMNASSQTLLPALMKNLTFDARRDFVGIAMVAESPMVLVTSKTKGFQTVKDLVAAGKANPGALTFASAGVGTQTQISAEKFRMAAGFKALHVPYKSTTDALAEVMSGRIDFLFTTLPSALGPVRDGRMVALALGMKRFSKLPDVPTLAEAGVPNAESTTWFGLFAAAKTPNRIVTKLHEGVENAVTDPEFKERLAQIGANPVSMSVDQFNAVLKREFVENDQLVKSIGIKLD